MKYLLRLIAFPAVLFLFWLSFSYLAFKRAFLFLLHGGELYSYEKNDKKTIDGIYRKLKQHLNNGDDLWEDRP